MNKKLKECETCDKWDERDNRMVNPLYCKFNCEAREVYQAELEVKGDRYDDKRDEGLYFKTP